MAKKKQSSRFKFGAEQEFDNVSVASSGTMGSEAQEDSFDEIMDQLIDSKSTCMTLLSHCLPLRASSKMTALREVVQLMSNYVLIEHCSSWETTLCRSFSQMIKRGRGDAPTLAARGFSLLILTLGSSDDSSRVWETIQSDLIPKSLSGKSLSLRSATLEAYALGCFVAEEDFFKVQSIMETLSDLWSHGTELATAAVRGWTLLLSSFDASMTAASDFGRELQHLRSLLETASGDLKEAVGMAVALLYTQGMDDDASDDASDGASVATSISQLDEMKDRMKDLSEARGPKIGRKQRAAQKAAFRNICGFIENGHITETKIKLQYGDVLTLTSLQKHIQMDFVRSMLGQGFHRHLHENPLLHTVFDFRPRKLSESRKTPNEKREHKSSHAWSKKIRSQTRDWERTQKRVYLHTEY